MKEARKGVSKGIPQNLQTTALKSNVPATAPHDIGIDSEAFVYMDPPLKKWTGLLCVLEMKGIAVFVEVERSITQLYVDKVEFYRWPSTDKHLNPKGLPVSVGKDEYRSRNITGRIVRRFGLNTWETSFKSFSQPCLTRTPYRLMSFSFPV